MSHRTQVTLTDEQYARLKAESRRSGLGLAELVRRALQVLYGKSARENPQAVLQATGGAWRKRHESGEQYVEQLRPGLAERERHVG